MCNCTYIEYDIGSMNAHIMAKYILSRSTSSTMEMISDNIDCHILYCL